MKPVYIITILLVMVAAGCAPKNPQTPPVQNKVMLSSSQYGPFAHLISGDTIDDNARKAITGFDVNKTVNPDGTTTINLIALNPEYSSHTYILNPGERLYFIEANYGDDSDAEYNLGDDTAVKVDADGYIIK